ncbi:hypothetical protein L249_0981, partial [Ophiocordyceps polyrhachis-furcata BCC 54312]
MSRRVEHNTSPALPSLRLSKMVPRAVQAIRVPKKTHPLEVDNVDDSILGHTHYIEVCCSHDASCLVKGPGTSRFMRRRPLHLPTNNTSSIITACGIYVSSTQDLHRSPSCFPISTTGHELLWLAINVVVVLTLCINVRPFRLTSLGRSIVRAGSSTSLVRAPSREARRSKYPEHRLLGVLSSWDAIVLFLAKAELHWTMGQAVLS